MNFDKLYSGADPDYELGLRVLRDRVNETHRVHQERAKAQAKAGA